MVMLRTSPPTSPSTYCMEYARMASVEELDSSLAMLSNYTPTSCKARRRQSSVVSSGTAGFDAQNPTGALITPPTTPDTGFSVVAHRWSSSSVSSTSSRSSVVSSTAQTSSSSTCIYQSGASSSSTSGLGSSEVLDKLCPRTPLPTPALYLDLAQVMRTATSASATGPNVVAIDNKIEQAMDLVKTHLTFAVREEVEILRSTIVELEAKVAQLESQNQVLKQFAPMEVVNSLALLVQQHQQQQKQMQLQQQQQQLPSGAITPIPGQATQGIQQQQSMPVIQSEAPVSVTALTGQSASAGLLTEVQQPVVEQQQQQQFNVQGGLGEAGKEQ